MIYQIRLYGDPILRRKARKIEDFSPIPKLAADLLESMYAANGVGLAAPQIGLGLRIFVAAEYEDRDDDEEPKVLCEYVVVNPELEITDASELFGTEGCLSIPNIYEDDVPRAKAIRMRYQNEHGEQQLIEAEDQLARIFQHEFDHLEGRLFFDLLPATVKTKYRQELAQMQRSARARLKKKK